MITIGRVKIDSRKTPEQLAKARIRARAWSLANPERKRAADAAYRAANAEKIRAYRKAYYEANRERHLAACRTRYLKNPEPQKRRAAEWARANSKKVYARNNARRIKRRESLKISLMKLQRGQCAYCREKLTVGKIHVDHIMPVALGGLNVRSNFQLTCDACNFSKNARHPVDFARAIGRLI